MHAERYTVLAAGRFFFHPAEILTIKTTCETTFGGKMRVPRHGVVVQAVFEHTGLNGIGFHEKDQANRGISWDLV